MFDEVRGSGRVGLPTIIIDEEIILDFDKEKLNEMLK